MTVHQLTAPKLTKNAVTVLERRYLKRDQQGKVIESPADMFRRVADAVAEADVKFSDDADVISVSEQFYGFMSNLEFIPNSPTLMNAGRELGQLSACFVLPVGDSMDEIFDSVKHTALIHKSGGGTGFSFSNLRPRNDVVRSTTGISSGPISFMRVFDIATETIKQGGTRRGANMGIMRVDHPDILEFIQCKSHEKHLNNFNISVGITELFMDALEGGESYPLINPRSREVVSMLKAKDVFDLIVKQAWENGEPGIIFLDRLNRDNPTPHIGTIESTNPCGEQPLLPYESCNLGSINLALMVKNGQVHWQRLREVVHLAVHFLDNVIELNRYPLPEIARMTYANRKIGLGVMGWADMLISLGIPYNSDAAIELAEKIMSFVNEEGHIASGQLARERGAFPNFKGSLYSQRGESEIRNATVTTIAPTGTISIIANTSSGIEPIFAVSFARQVLDNDILLETHPLFEKIARERGFYSSALMEKIAQHGTIQDIEEIPFDVRRVFVTAHDIMFTTMGKAGGCAASQSEAIGRMVSLAWRSGVQPEEVIKQLLDISCHSPAGFGANKILSCADAVARAIRNHLASAGHAEKMDKRSLFKGACPECGGRIEHEGGCSVCHSCGFSECA